MADKKRKTSQNKITGSPKKQKETQKIKNTGTGEKEHNSPQQKDKEIQH